MEPSPLPPAGSSIESYSPQVSDLSNEGAFPPGNVEPLRFQGSVGGHGNGKIVGFYAGVRFRDTNDEREEYFDEAFMNLPQAEQGIAAEKGKAKKDNQSAFTTPVPSQPSDEYLLQAGGISPTSDKKREKLGYYRSYIACNHCRRRKIRCQVPTPEDAQGRCTNCIRLKKACIFSDVNQPLTPQLEDKTSSSVRRNAGLSGTPLELVRSSSYQSSISNTSNLGSVADEDETAHMDLHSPKVDLESRQHREDDGYDSGPGAEQGSDSNEPRPATTMQVDEDFTIEDISEDETRYKDLEVIKPDQLEEISDDEETKSRNQDIIDALKDLHFAGDEKDLERAGEYEAAQQEAYLRRRKRWSSGGYLKRRHAQSVGSESSGSSDVDFLDDTDMPGGSTRRLRRRVRGPTGSKPSYLTSHLHPIPLKEQEELTAENGTNFSFSDPDGDLSTDSSSEDGLQGFGAILPSGTIRIKPTPSRPSTPVSTSLEPWVDSTARESTSRINEEGENSFDVTRNQQPLDLPSRSVTSDAFGARSDNLSFEQEISQKTTTKNSSESDTESEGAYSLPSVDSMAFTRSSMTSYAPQTITTTFVQEFCYLLLQDRLLSQQCLTALKTDTVRRDRLQRNFRRCLKSYAVNLKDEANGNAQRIASAFVLRYSNRISSDFISLLLPDDKSRAFDISDQIEDKRRLMEDYLKRLPITPMFDDDGPTHAGDYDSENDSEPIDDIDYENTFTEEEPRLNLFKEFLTRGPSFEVFRSSIQEFLHPTFESKLRLLIKAFANGNYKVYSAYNLSHLPAELRDVDLRKIEIAKPKTSGLERTWLESFQEQAEHWSGASWDWWPLAPPERMIEAGERRLNWTCTCGQRRNFTVPVEFARKLKDLIRDFAGVSERAPGTTPQTTGASELNSSMSAGQSSSTAGQGQPMASTNIQPGFPLRTLTVMPGSSNAPPSNFTQTRGLHVIMVVESGNSFLLSQIDVKGINCNKFFRTLRMEYQQLRGFWRNWFSIWRYSHCDFYKCEKFDDQEFAPTQKNAFPSIVDRDYEYRPRPIDAMPPVSRHEFFARFYTCTDPTSLQHRTLHLLTGCKRLGMHSHERLDLFPKRLSRFEEKGNEVGFFWGIYAREKPALRYILFYNILCLLSPFAYFFLRVFMVGNAHELQDASVPIVIVAGCLSIFWSLFFGSIQESRNAKID